jgi:type IV secretion system protein VirB3
MEESLTETVLHVAGTRPALIFGLPIELAIPLFIATVEVAVAAGLWVILMVPCWWGLSWFVRKDYNAARVFTLWFRTSAFDFDVADHGGVSVNPLPFATERRFRGIP